jgi:hypothetical protein
VKQLGSIGSMVSVSYRAESSKFAFLYAVTSGVCPRMFVNKRQGIACHLMSGNIPASSIFLIGESSDYEVELMC